MARRIERVALLCLDPWQIRDSVDNRPFNYAVRRVQAAILGDPALSHLEVELIESHELDEDALAARIEAFDPDFIGASAYVWSFPTMLEVCRRAVQERPDRVIVFGGPSARPEMFELPQHRDSEHFVDAICVGEGEACITEMLQAPDPGREAFSRIAGLAVHDGKRWLHTAPRDYGPPDQHPSPYQMGLMPSGVTAQFESFRGCPLSCSYCEWGETGVVSRLFGHEHLVRELEALKSLDAKGTWLVDAGLNLNARSFRNLSRAEAEVGALRAIGDFRCEIYPSHLKDIHLQFLQDVSATYAGIGLQSFDAEVLKGVDRPFNEDRFNTVVSEVASIVPDTTVEIIMGLPGDDPDTFKRTLEKARKLPVSIRVFHCLALPSALMKNAPPEYEMRFDPFTLQLISCLGWSRKDIEDTCRWLDDIALDESGDVPHGGTWKFQRTGPLPGGHEAQTERTPELSRRQREAEPHPNLVADLRRRVARASGWQLTDVRFRRGDARCGVILGLDVQGAHLQLRATPQADEARWYAAFDGVAYTHKGDVALDDEALRTIDGLIAALRTVLKAVVLGHEVGPKPWELPVLEVGAG